MALLLTLATAGWQPDASAAGSAVAEGVRLLSSNRTVLKTFVELGRSRGASRGMTRAGMIERWQTDPIYREWLYGEVLKTAPEEMRFVVGTAAEVNRVILPVSLRAEIDAAALEAVARSARDMFGPPRITESRDFLDRLTRGVSDAVTTENIAWLRDGLAVPAETVSVDMGQVEMLRDALVSTLRDVPLGALESDTAMTKALGETRRVQGALARHLKRVSYNFDGDTGRLVITYQSGNASASRTIDLHETIRRIWKLAKLAAIAGTGFVVGSDEETDQRQSQPPESALEPMETEATGPRNDGEEEW